MIAMFRFVFGVLSVFVSGLFVGLCVKSGASNEKITDAIRTAYQKVQVPEAASVFIGKEEPLSTSMLFVQRLGLDRSAIGSKYFYYAHDIDAAIPYCFSDAALIRARMFELCPETFPSSSMRACKGIDGWTCSLAGESQSQPVDANAVQVNYDQTSHPCHQFAPVCCRMGATSHPVPNYCVCQQKGGVLVSPGPVCK